MQIAELLNLPPEQLHCLKDLDLSYNRIGNLRNDRLQVFCAALSQCTSLIHLDLKGNRLNNIDYEGWQYLSDAISNLKSLEHLLLFNNSLGDIDNQSCNALSMALSQCIALQTLDLDDNNLSSLEMDELKAIFHAISTLPYLVRLSLSYNKLEKLENARLLEFFEVLSKCTSLESLGLSGNGFGYLENKTCNALGAALSKCTYLQTLDLDTNDLDELNVDKLKSIFEAISKLNNLVSLSLCTNNLGRLENNILLPICQALSQCTSLRNLRLKGNCLDGGVWGRSYDSSSKVLLKYFAEAFTIKNSPLIKIDGLPDSWAGVLYYKIPSLVSMKPFDANIENNPAAKNRLLLRMCFASNIQMLINNGLNAGIAAKILTYLFPWFKSIIEELANKDACFISNEMDFKKLSDAQLKKCVTYSWTYANRTLLQANTDVYVDGKLQIQDKDSRETKKLKIS